MRVVQTRKGVTENLDVHVHRESSAAKARENLLQRLAVEVLHDEVVAVPLVTDLQRLHDVRMVQARRQASLIQEHSQELRIACELCLELLDNQQLVEPAFSTADGEVDDAHPAFCELRNETVATQRGGRAGALAVSNFNGFHGLLAWTSACRTRWSSFSTTLRLAANHFAADCL